MNGLYRTYIETDPRWSHVGPQHERLYFNHHAFVGYAPRGGGGFCIYGMNSEYPDKTFKTIPAAKRAALRWLKKLIPELECTPVAWEAIDTGVHWVAKVKGFDIANYYKCDQATAKWHVGFRVWFAGTFYTTPFKDADEARIAVEASWREWLRLAREHILHETPVTPTTPPHPRTIPTTVN